MKKLKIVFIYFPLLLIILHVIIILFNFGYSLIYYFYPGFLNSFSSIIIAAVAFLTLGSFLSDKKEAKVYQISLFILPLLSIFASYITFKYLFLVTEAIVFSIISIVPVLLFHFLFKRNDKLKTLNKIFLTIVLVISSLNVLLIVIAEILPIEYEYDVLATVDSPDNIYKVQLFETSYFISSDTLVTVIKNDASNNEDPIAITVYTGNWGDTPAITWKNNNTFQIDEKLYEIENLNNFPDFVIKK